MKVSPQARLFFLVCLFCIFEGGGGYRLRRKAFYHTDVRFTAVSWSSNPEVARRWSRRLANQRINANITIWSSLEIVSVWSRAREVILIVFDNKYEPLDDWLQAGAREAAAGKLHSEAMTKDVRHISKIRWFEREQKYQAGRVKTNRVTRVPFSCDKSRTSWDRVKITAAISGRRLDVDRSFKLAQLSSSSSYFQKTHLGKHTNGSVHDFIFVRL